MKMFGLAEQNQNLTQKEKVEVVLKHQQTMQRKQEEKQNGIKETKEIASESEDIFENDSQEESKEPRAVG